MSVRLQCGLLPEDVLQGLKEMLASGVLGQAEPKAARAFLERNKEMNYGRSEVISGAEWTTLVSVDIERHEAWTVVVDTQQITQDGVNWDGQQGAVSARVILQVEQGAGSGISTTQFDATDVVAIPVVGNHIKVDAKLVSADTVVVPAGGANGLAAPAAASVNARALVSGYLSSKMAHFPAPSPAACTYHAIPLFGAASPFSSVAAQGIVSTVPVRVAGFHATNTSTTVTAYLTLLSQATLVGGGTPPANLVKDVLAIPPATTVSQSFGGGLPFDRGLVWVSSTTSTKVTTGGPSLDVRIELVRQPTVAVVPAIARVG